MLSLIPFERSHFDVLASWFCSEHDAVQWGGPNVEFPIDAAQLADLLEQGSSDPPARKCWMVEIQGGIVGHAQIAFDWRHGTARIARVAIAPTARGRGLAVPMLTLIVQEAFSRRAIERVELNVYSFNHPALRTYERVGLKTEGIRRSAVRVGVERWDSVMMAMLRTEWDDRASEAQCP